MGRCPPLPRVPGCLCLSLPRVGPAQPSGHCCSAPRKLCFRDSRERYPHCRTHLRLISQRCCTSLGNSAAEVFVLITLFKTSLLLVISLVRLCAHVHIHHVCSAQSSPSHRRGDFPSPFPPALPSLHFYCPPVETRDAFIIPHFNFFLYSHSFWGQKWKPIPIRQGRC